MRTQAPQKAGKSNRRHGGFSENKSQIELSKGIRRAVITGNILTGKERITNLSQGQVKLADNAGG